MFANAAVQKLLIISAATLALSGCVVAIGDKTETASESTWRKTLQFNLQSINQLSLGVSSEEVRQQLGAPDFSELFQKDGQQVQVLFYRTHHRNSDGKKTKAECTPLNYKDNQLTAWGDKAYQYMLQGC